MLRFMLIRILQALPVIFVVTAHSTSWSDWTKFAENVGQLAFGKACAQAMGAARATAMSSEPATSS